jgi:AraC-like DNA-binding protein
MPVNHPADEAAAQYHFTTEDLPERDRIPIWREEFGRKLGRWELEPLSYPVYADFTLRAMPDLKLMTIRHSAVRVTRTAELVADGDDDFILVISMNASSACHLGREVEIKEGDAFLSSNADTGIFVVPSPSSECILLGLSRQRLRPLLGDFDSVVARPVRANAPALALLKGYVDIFSEQTALEPELDHVIATHVYDLAAAALGATSGAAETAKRRGLRAARLRAAKTCVLHNLNRSELSAAMVAAELGVTPRYIHMLFETENESFTEFMLSRRLAHAHRMLNDPRFDALTISAIALDAGFADLSHFNHRFRRRFGATPTDVRKQARAPRGLSQGN